MIPLTNNSSSTSQKLQAFLSGAAATTNPTVTVSFYDLLKQAKDDNSDYPLANQFTVLAGSTETDVCAAPNTGVTRHITAVNVYNADTAPITVTVCVDDNGTNRILVKQVLQVAETMRYVSYLHGGQWFIL